MDRKERYYMSSVRLGPKGQIVIPKEARDMFGLQPGDTLVLLADKKKGLALQTAEKLNPMLKKCLPRCRRKRRMRTNECAGGAGPDEALPGVHPGSRVV